MRSHLGVRLSYEAKYWLESIQASLQTNLEKKVQQTDLENLENVTKEYLAKIDEELKATSITIILKISASSVLEEALDKTKSLTTQEWHQLDSKMKSAIREVPKNINLGTLSVRFYLEQEVVSKLESYQKALMTDSMLRPLRMSYIIKLVIFAYYNQLKNSSSI